LYRPYDALLPDTNLNSKLLRCTIRRSRLARIADRQPWCCRHPGV